MIIMISIEMKLYLGNASTLWNIQDWNPSPMCLFQNKTHIKPSSIIVYPT